MKFEIPENCHIRWQAALAVLEDLQEDEEAPFSMYQYASALTQWEKTNGCGSPACYAGYISVSPYCRALGLPDTHGVRVVGWLVPGEIESGPLWTEIFRETISKGSRAKTLAYLEKTLKGIFKESTGKILKAPLTFWVD